MAKGHTYFRVEGNWGHGFESLDVTDTIDNGIDIINKDKEDNEPAPGGYIVVQVTEIVVHATPEAADEQTH